MFRRYPSVKGMIPCIVNTNRNRQREKDPPKKFIIAFRKRWQWSKGTTGSKSVEL